MNTRRQVNAVAARLSLRPPQRQALEILDRVTEIVPPHKDTDLQVALAAICSEYPTVSDFEREFPSLCFALATGVGKTRLMGAFIAYLHLAHGLNNFFILAPNLTIYNKLITDFTPNTPKYVFKGITEFSIDPPLIITGDTYDDGRGVRGTTLPGLHGDVHINIFNISKLNSEVRGGKAPRMRRLSEVIGDSYFNYLAELDDLVLLMDESHRYRASAGMRAINELKPVLGLELTATPFVESTRGPVPFRNVIQDYPLSKALEDGFIKEPAVVTRKDFSPVGIPADEMERLKLEDGIRLHEIIKVELRTYARETGNRVVKPFLLVIARDTYHATQLVQRIESELFEGRYVGKVLQVDSKQTGADEDAMVKNLLAVEDVDNEIEIVVHVNMLKEGWDVTNLYTIVPLRAANARTLIEQSIGRGLRLPYGKRTGVVAVDRLNIVAHDKFQEIVDEASRPDSIIRLKQVILDPELLAATPITVISQPQLEIRLGIQPSQMLPDMRVAASESPPAFATPREQEIAQIAYQAIRRMENRPDKLPGVASLQKADVQAQLLQEVQAQYRPVQMEMDALIPAPDFAAIVAATTELVIQQTIDIPRILVIPKEEVKTGFRDFTPDVSIFGYDQAPSEDIVLQHLRTHQQEILTFGRGGVDATRLEDYIVYELIEFNDVSYDDNADLLYDLAGQTVEHFRTYLNDDEIRRVLQMHKTAIAKNLHLQMQQHYWEEPVEHETKISKGFSALKPSAYTASATEPPLNFRFSPPDKSNMAKYLFGGFERCLYSVQKFHSEAERILAVILERDSLKWFKPAKGQFQIFYKQGADHHEYVPDFVAETNDMIYLLEPKAINAMNDPIVLAKRDVAIKWCAEATTYAQSYGGKSWKYLLIPHTALNEGMTISGLARMYA